MSYLVEDNEFGDNTENDQNSSTNKYGIPIHITWARII